MVTYHKLGKYMTADPFRPFRISMANRESFKISDPEMIRIGRSTIYIDLFMSDEPEQSNQRKHEVSLLLIKSVELRDVASAQEGKP